VTRLGESGLAVRSYGRLAEAYDLIHAGKPYRAEARIVARLARRLADRPVRSLLDVACGSGRHLAEFSRWFDCAGVDASPEMLALAHRRAPRASLTLGEMASFRLGRRFDVVTCLFSAIGYVRSRAELRRTIRNLARHTAPGGLVFVEPWLTPSAFRSGRVHYRLAESNRMTVLRMDAGRRVRGRSVFDFHHLMGREGTVEHVVETHDLALFPGSTLRAAFRDAGLSVRYYRRGVGGLRGLYVGRRAGARREGGGPAPTAARSRRRARR
jgi:SAM-dependent methyltransferase